MLGDCDGLTFATLETIAFDVLDERAEAHGTPAPRRIDDVRAAALFEPIGAKLFGLEWDEFVTDEIDPEITGLRAPERFAAAAFRLIRKLRAASISPEEFKRACFAGATRFYAHPPNFSSPDLILDTPPKYRDSLRASPDELARQHAREIDLAKILVRLYETYAESLPTSGSLSGTDALLEAAAALRAEPALRSRVREWWSGAYFDDAQDFTLAHLGLIEALFGESRRGVTLAGDERAATTTFEGSLGKAAFRGLPFSYELPPRPVHLGIARAVDLGSGAVTRTTIPKDGSVEFYRASDKRDEAAWVAATVATLVRKGTAPSAIAVIMRSLPCASVYVDALLARDVPVDLAGRANLYDTPAAADALAILWALADPYRHDWLLRVLESPSVALADASIATLCGEPATPQTPLFEMPDDDDGDDVRGRWDRRRDLRLGRNVTRGDADADLPDEARRRIEVLREDLQRYERLERELEVADLARTILAERALAAAPGSARARYDAGIVERICDDVADFAAREPLATLHDYLLEVERACTFDADLLSIEARDAAAVRVLDVEAAKGLAFAHVFVVDVKAGAFPQYYVPDAFLFTPKYGMTAKENVGDASAARTAKFTYLSHAQQFKQKFVAQERRAFGVAASRATERLYIGTSGKPTKGVGAPEIAAELRAVLEP
jgi:superfamily I DNA/RNA helicase